MVAFETIMYQNQVGCGHLQVAVPFFDDVQALTVNKLFETYV